MSPFGPSMSIKIITRWVAPTPLVFRNLVLDHTQSSPWFSIDTPKRLWKCSFAGPHHGCCHSNVYRRWDIKPKMWEIWKWLHHPMEEPPNKNRPHFCGQVWHWIRHFCRMIGLQEWSYLVIFHHEPSLRGRKQVGKNRCLGMFPTSTTPVTALILTFVRKVPDSKNQPSHSWGRSQHTPQICPYSLPTTKFGSKKSGESLQRNQGFQSHQLESDLRRNAASSIACFYINQRTYHLILLCQ